MIIIINSPTIMEIINIIYSKDMDSLFILILIIISAHGKILKLMDMEPINIIKVWDILDHGKMIINMVKDNNIGKMVLYSKANFFKDLKYMVNFIGQMVHHILVNLIKTNYKEKENLHMKMVDIIMVNGKII